MLFSVVSSASVPHVMSVQGKAVNKTSGALLTTGNITIRAYDNLTNGNLVFNDTFNNTISNGTFNVLLGSQLALNLTYNKMYFMELAINTETVIGSTARRQFFATGGPNQTILQVEESIGYVNITSQSASQPALRLIGASSQTANLTEWLNSGLTALAFITRSGGAYFNGSIGIGIASPTSTLEVTGIANVLALNVNNTLYVNTTTSSVGIGTTNPASLLHVVGTITSSTDAKGVRLYPTLNPANAYDAYGVAIAPTIAADTDSISAFYSLYIDTPTTPSPIPTITDAIQLYITSPGAIATNTYALYSSGGTNYFGGNVGIGTTRPYRKLQINGSGGVSLETNESAYFAVTSGRVGIGTASPDAVLGVSGSANVLALNVNNTLYVNTTTSYVGIGTSIPNALLHVAGNIISTGTLFGQLSAANLTSISSLNYGILISQANISGITIPASNVTGKDYTLLVSQGNITGITIPANNVTNGTFSPTNYVFPENVSFMNRIGIGTASPNEKLQINGSIFLTATTVSNATVSYNSSDLILQAYGSNGTAATTTPNVTFRNVANTGNLSFRLGIFTNNTERMSIDSSGNVGIGTTAPYTKLQINGSGGVSLETNESAYFAVTSGRVGISTTSPDATLGISGSANILALNVNNTLYVNTTTSRIGIGTTAPSATLDVRGAIYVNNGGSGSPTISFNADTNTGLYRKQDEVMALAANGQEAMLMSGATGIGTLAVGNVVPAQEKFLITGSGTMDYMKVSRGNNEQGDVFIIDRNGSVGINVMYPTARLHINATNGTGGVNGTLRDALRIINATGAELLFVNGTTGSVGIGTTGPVGILHLLTSAGTFLDIQRGKETADAPGGNAVIRFRNTTGTEKWSFGYSTQIGDGAGFSLWQDGEISKTRLYIADGGSVGIGTTAPYRKLQINGSGGVSLETNESVYLATVAGQKVGIGNTAPASTLEVTGSANVLALNINNTLYVNTTTSNIGIGTASPNRTLEIFKNASTNDGIRLSGNGTQYDSLDIEWRTSLGSHWNIDQYGSDGQLRFFTEMDDAEGGGSVRMVIMNSTGNLGIGTTAPYRRLQVNGTGGALEVNDSVYLAVSGGNVGIGSLSPTTKLYVNGTVNATRFYSERTRTIWLPPAMFNISSGTPFLSSFGSTAADSSAAWTFNDTEEENIGTAFELPADWVPSSDVTFRFRWAAANATTGDVVWYISMNSIADGDSVDETFSFNPSTTVGAGGTARRRATANLTVGGGNFASGSTVRLRVARLGDNGADTMLGNALLLGVLVEYKGDV